MILEKAMAFLLVRLGDQPGMDQSDQGFSPNKDGSDNFTLYLETIAILAIVSASPAAVRASPSPGPSRPLRMKRQRTFALHAWTEV